MRACCEHDRLHCFLPPYILERLAESPDPEVRRLAVEAVGAAAEARTARLLLSLMPALAAVPSPSGKKHRLVYDMGSRTADTLPGRLVRAEGERAVRDRAVNEAYNGCGHVHDFFRRVCSRNSIDDRGMTLVSSVHVGEKYNNAFWNGVQIAFGDGDGVLFRRFTRSLDVIGHELTHGVVTHTANLEYRGQSGALNEHFADVFGILIGQWRRKETAAGAEWLIGKDIMGPKVRARALRTFTAGKAFEDDPYFGTDPQPKHMDDIYTGEADRGGVHINSGIPNYAFYRIATALGGRAWERAGRIWYELLLRLRPTTGFQEAAEASLQAASELFPRSRMVKRAVRDGWKAAGVDIG
jgi:Zn-dependent metalloprotease